MLRADHFDDETLVVEASKPVLAHFAEDLSTASVSAVVTDREGNVLVRRVDDRSLLTQLDRISLAPGAVYAEDSIGTNAIGTALAQERASSVEGNEHFANALIGMSCAAAPIHDPRTGSVLGVFDLTCVVEDTNRLMLPLARAAVREVERRLLDDIGDPDALIGWRSLTDTEQRVAILVAEGLTNKEVANQMLMSPYTVDAHLRSSFRKLSIHSRS